VLHITATGNHPPEFLNGWERPGKRGIKIVIACTHFLYFNLLRCDIQKTGDFTVHFSFNRQFPSPSVDLLTIIGVPAETAGVMLVR